jgi:hypothetical protein
LDVSAVDKKIILNDDYTIHVKFPTYNDVTNSELDYDTATEQLYSTMIACLDKLITEDEQIDFKDQPKAEIEDFLESLTGEQVQKLMEFIQSIPSMKYEGEFNCTSCNEKNEFKLQGMQDFF